MKKLLTKTEFASSYMTEKEILSELKRLKDLGATDIELNSCHRWGDDGIEWEYKVPETNEQYEDRLAEELAKEEAEKLKREEEAKKRQQKLIQKRQSDRELYEKLKKQFEPDA